MPKPADDFKKGDRVHDVWWPFRVGKVTRVLKTRVHVEWPDGEVWKYDLAHTKFLRK
jgi:hypothetical protein